MIWNKKCFSAMIDESSRHAWHGKNISPCGTVKIKMLKKCLRMNSGNSNPQILSITPCHDYVLNFKKQY